MRRRVELIASSALVFAAFAGAAAASGCGDDSETTPASCDAEIGADGCFDAAACYKAGPERSFKEDVLPIFERSCSLSASCHGSDKSPTTAMGYQPYLGEVNPDMKPSDTAKIIGLIVGQPSKAATSMNIVEAGNAASSFLMLKMDNALKCAQLTCNFSACGDPMPQTSPTLPLTDRNVVRDWINQGAKDN